jgi:hypothetical protein
MVAILVRRSRCGAALFNRQQSAVSGLCEPQKRKTKRGEQVRSLPGGTHS